MLVILDLLSTVSFACTGVLLASRNARGYLGILVSAMLTATGGGTVREFLLRSDGIFWLENYTYLLAVGVAMPLAILVNRMPHKPNYLSSVLDSIATGVFILVGVTAALDAGCNMLFATLMGVLTGIGGGVLRDALLEKKFTLFREAHTLLIPISVSVLCNLLVSMGVTEIVIIITLATMLFFLRQYHQRMGEIFDGRKARDPKTYQKLQKRAGCHLR